MATLEVAEVTEYRTKLQSDCIMRRGDEAERAASQMVDGVPP